MGHSPEQSRPELCTDVVPFCVFEARLRVFLTPVIGALEAGSWSLPRRSVRQHQDLQGAAEAEVGDKLGFSNAYLEQLYTFSHSKGTLRDWSITVAYFALIAPDRASAPAGREIASPGRWFSVEEIPEVPSDQEMILAMARQRLADKLLYSTIAFQLMAPTFTLSELQCVYEAVLGEALDKRNFRRRMLALERLEETGEARRQVCHRPAKLFRPRYPTRVEIIR